MPFKSKSQRKLFYYLKSKGKMDQATIDEWEKDTPKNIPERVEKMAGFYTGFEKKAILADLPMYAGKAGKKLLDKMTTKMVQQRLRNTPGMSFSEARGRELFKQMRKGEPGATAHLQMMPGSMIPNVAGEGASLHVLPPESMFNKLLLLSKKTRPMGKAMRNPQSRSGIVHHELDELASSAAKKTMEPTMAYRSPAGSMMHSAMREGAKASRAKGGGLAGFYHGTKAAYPGVRDAMRVGKQHPQMAQHMGPEVLINESNRAFHAMGEKARSNMQGMRAGNEADLLKRHGLRYGEEYVQPGTRRYNKLVKNIEKAVRESGGDSSKLFPVKPAAGQAAPAVRQAVPAVRQTAESVQRERIIQNRIKKRMRGVQG